jgi:hypothetical protein
VKEFIMGINIFWSSTRKFERRDCISFVVGGVCGIKTVRISISHLLDPSDHIFLESTTIKIFSPDFDFPVPVVQCPPNKRITLHHLSTFLSLLGCRFLLGGDFNAKHP